MKARNRLGSECMVWTDVPGIPAGDYYPEIHRVSELPQVLMLPIS